MAPEPYDLPIALGEQVKPALSAASWLGKRMNSVIACYVLGSRNNWTSYKIN